MFEISNEDQSMETNKNQSSAKIKVVGVGGAGGNAVNTMIRSGLSGVEYIAINTDMQALEVNLATNKLQIGSDITKGLGAGANPEVGRKSALEAYDKLSELLTGADMVFITGGMGGGTGTGAAPVVAKLAMELGALTVGVVTRPFLFEGKKRIRQAELGIRSLEDSVDSLITIPNQRLLYLAGEGLSLIETFKKADDVLLNAVRGISDLITHTGIINVDFADVRTVMANRGMALMGTGISTGPDRAIKAATEAINSPLLEDLNIDGATGIIINIAGNGSLTTHETNEAVTLIMEAADEDAEIIFGTVIDEELKEEIKITVIATGLGDQKEREERVDSQKREVHETETSTTKEVEDNLSLEGGAQQKEVERERVLNDHDISKVVSDASRDYEINRDLERQEFVRPERRSDYQIPKVDLKEQEIQREKEMDTPQGDGRAKSIAERLGFINFDEDEFDTPSFLRKDRQVHDESRDHRN